MSKKKKIGKAKTEVVKEAPKKKTAPKKSPVKKEVAPKVTPKKEPAAEKKPEVKKEPAKKATKKKTAETTEFEPQLLTFCCNWCSYAGADLAGVSRFQYPPNIRIVRVMCSGRVEPMFILNAFKNGIDGVLITGCHINDCHYISGNEYALKRMNNVESLLKKIGIEEGRFRLHWISASEGKQFSELITDFTNTIKKLGPSKFPKKLGVMDIEIEEVV